MIFFSIYQKLNAKDFLTGFYWGWKCLLVLIKQITEKFQKCKLNCPNTDKR